MDDTFTALAIAPYSFGSSSNNPNNLSMYFILNSAYDPSTGDFHFYPYGSTFNQSWKRNGFNYLSTDYVVLSGGGNCSSVGQSIDNTGSYPKILGVSKEFLEDFVYQFNLPLDVSNAGSTNYLYVPVVDMYLDWENAHLSSSYNESGYYGSCKLGSISQSYTLSSSSDDPSGGSTSDYSGIISAITLIPATIICVCLFKMIFNVFMNRKVRG